MGILPKLRWHPTGRRLSHWPDLVDGQQVQGYCITSGNRRPFRTGWISREVEDWNSFKTDTVYINYEYRGSICKEILCKRYFDSDSGYKDESWQRRSYNTFELYSVNLIKENQTMANKLLGLIRLDKNQRKLQKVGIYDENGNLTPDGQEVVLNLIAKDKEAQLVELSKDWKTEKDKKDKSEDE